MDEKTHSFIIRIWETIEDRVNGLEGTWRGSIDYVGSEKRLYFNDLDSIVAFIQEQVLADGSQSVARWDALVERNRFGRRVRAFWRRWGSRIIRWWRGRSQIVHRQGNSQ